MMERIRECGSGLAWFAVALILALTLNARDARADTWLSSTVTSYHFDRSVKHNECNLGLGLEYDIAKDARLVGGFYDNSMHHLSLYGGVTYTPLHPGPANVGVMAGPVNGYGEHPRRWWPLVAPVVQFEGARFGINLIGAPKVLKHEGVIGLQLKLKF